MPRKRIDETWPRSIAFEGGKVTLSKREDGATRITIADLTDGADVDAPLDAIAMYEHERAAILDALEWLGRSDPERADVARELLRKPRR